VCVYCRNARQAAERNAFAVAKAPRTQPRLLIAFIDRLSHSRISSLCVCARVPFILYIVGACVYRNAHKAAERNAFAEAKAAAAAAAAAEVNPRLRLLQRNHAFLLKSLIVCVCVYCRNAHKAAERNAFAVAKAAAAAAAAAEVNPRRKLL